MTQKLKPLLLAFALLLASAHGSAAVTDDIRALAASAKQPQQRYKRPYDEQDWLERFYAARAYAPAWLGPNAGRAAAAVALLEEAATQGLPPADYQAEALDKQLRAATPADAAFDVALTRAMLHYLADLRVGRVRSEYHSAGPDPRLKSFDPVEQLRIADDENRLAGADTRAQPRIPFNKRT
ncbi:MAG: hypothetical protein H7176_14420, partial [Bdellovibrionales bacterium]|nr:hypothetical protein [Massilia sp.]